MQQPTPPATPRAAQQISAPQTRSDLEALTQLRSELRDQLQSVNSRRIELIAQQRVMGERGASDAAKRIAALDEQGARLEQQISAADQAITAGIGQGLAIRRPIEAPRAIVTVPPLNTNLGKSVSNIMAANALSIGLTAVIVWGIARRRLRAAGVTPALADQARRMDQLQQAVDTMAVEIERISEGQRYVTKVLSERLPATTGRSS